MFRDKVRGRHQGAALGRVWGRGLDVGYGGRV
jgi:hypothetical protein